jgi:hypothetical protein
LNMTSDHISSLECDPQATPIGIPVTQEKFPRHRRDSCFTGKWSCITKDFLVSSRPQNGLTYLIHCKNDINELSGMPLAGPV